MTPEEFADPVRVVFVTTTASPASPATRNTDVWKICSSGFYEFWFGAVARHSNSLRQSSMVSKAPWWPHP